MAKFGVLAVLGILLGIARSEPQVYILSENFQQVVTSTALQWMPANTKTKSFDDAVVGAYLNLQEEGTEDNAASNSLSGQSVYVCRVRQNGIWVSGQVRQNERKCIVSLHGIVHVVDRYEILINIEGSARLSWVKKDKFVLYPPGAVTGGDEPFRTYVGRKATDGQSTLTHYLGKLDPSQNHGKYTVITEKNTELEFEDGEVLVETEAIRYDISKVKFDEARKRIRSTPKILGEAVLKNENEDEETDKVVTAISYNYTYNLNWGNKHGMLNGIPFNVLDDATRVHNGSWGIKVIKERIELADVDAFLAPGTAVNVTLRGNYVESEIPYTATVTSHYKDGEVKSRIIKDSKIEFGMRNVVPEYGPVYFLHNNSFVPTTTTTTTTTTSTTTPTTTTRKTTTEEVTPITSPDVEMSKKHNLDSMSSPDGKHENNILDSGEASSLKKKEDSTRELKSAPSAATQVTVTLLLLATPLLVLT